mgnify:CR=1 FL=1
MDIKEILSKVDHTLLSQNATWNEIKAICDDGIKYETASVCIPASYVKQAKEYVCDKLNSFGMTPNKSLTLEFPKWLNPELYSHFIRGYFDGDGGVSYTEGVYYNKDRKKEYKQHSYSCYFCGNKQFLIELKLVLENNNIKVSDLREDKRSNAVNIYIYGKENIERFKEFIYTDNCVNLSRKYDKFLFISNNKSLHINR